MILTHPNRRAFVGVLTRIDEASSGALKGAKLPSEHKRESRRVILTSAAAREALPSLIGMPVNWAQALSGHQMKRIGGIITDADIDGADLIVSGYVFAKNLPTEVASLDRNDLGMSFESDEAFVRTTSTEDVWEVHKLRFTGATVMLRKDAAFRSTSFNLLPTSSEVPVHLGEQTGTSIEQLLYA